MASNAAETLIGAAVLAAAAGFIVYAGQTADLGAGGDRYELKAAFRKAEGISVGADVRVSGVKVGSVTGLDLNPQTYQAVARFAIDDTLKLPDDTSASIQSEGLLGGNYVALTPGGSDLMLAPGEEILYTQGSVNLLDLVGRAISSVGGSE